MVTVKTIWSHVCYKQEPLSYFKGLKMRTFGFWQKETGLKTVSIASRKLIQNFGCDKKGYNYVLDFMVLQHNSLHARNTVSNVL